MFNTWTVKDSKRSIEQKRKMLPANTIFNFRHDETALPYFEIMPGSLLSDNRYQNLSPQDQGAFLRLTLFMWLEKCRIGRFGELIAANLGMKPEEWNGLEERLLNAKLLVLSTDGLYLVQTELRNQYLLNRQANLNKIRLKLISVSANEGTEQSAT